MARPDTAVAVVMTVDLAVGGPLRGVKVVDMTRLMPGDYCTYKLASLGADVIKIEDPGAGDYMRSFGVQVDGQSAIHHIVNRAKRSVVVDLKKPDGVALLRALIREADILVESFRPGVLRRLGLDPAELRAGYPSLVIVSLSGYGASGDMSCMAGHDINYSAISGVLDRTGAKEGSPTISPVNFADLIGGSLLPAIGAVSLLHQARATGVGGHLDSGIAEALALLPSIVVADLLAGTIAPGRGESDWGGGLACWRVYALRDGHVAVGAVEGPFWSNLCHLLGLPELAGLQYVASEQDRIAGALQETFSAHDRESIAMLLDGVDTCATVVESYEELFSSRFAQQRDLLHTHPSIPLPVPASPFMIDGIRPRETIRAPFQGEHTTEVLADWGISRSEIEQLERDGVVRQWKPTDDNGAGPIFGAKP